MAFRRDAKRFGQVSRGFVLALTLWILAAMAVVAATVAVWSVSRVREATTSTERLTQWQSVVSTRDTLLYLFATTAVTRAGLPGERMSDEDRALRRLDEFGGLDKSPLGGELRLDGTAYRGLQGSVFSLQDESGLLSLYWPQPAYVDRMLGGFGVPDPEIPTLRDRLLDYIDADKLKRLQGAEEQEYRREGQSPPPNRRLIMARELGMVLGWDERRLPQLAAMSAYVSTNYSGALNPNVVPAALFPRLFPGCPESCAVLVRERDTRPFTSYDDVRARTGIVLPGDDMASYRFAPSEFLQMTFSAEQGAAWRIHVVFTPIAHGSAPWRVSSAYSIDRPASHDITRATRSPLLSDPAVGE